ncbi:hypothetical protein BG910_11040 [Neisseria chenwenguii]|uniref:Uncharacterized protein n=1 Tax=Neisseria chenwenguii TaxID=1853278 RepID=A0A220S4C4_9NEIS|nr:TrbI F-type domain-containing protein [Neisseria chenwenguii]ASK28193.1 hypothetical protein BG910_11040 [Neisseria chenwenguii]
MNETPNKTDEAGKTGSTGTAAQQPETLPENGRPATSGGSGLTTVMVLLALVLGGYSFFRTIVPTAATTEKLAVVDSDRLAAAYIRQALSDPQADTPAAQQKLAAQLSGIQAKLDAMAAEGRIIVRKSAVLTAPPGADITAQVAAELGITLPSEQPLPQAGSSNSFSGSTPVPTGLPANQTPANASDARLGSQLD